MTLAKKITQILTEKNQTLSLAESCTGGLLAHWLTNIPGSSKFLKAGIVAYANETKEKFLRVPRATLEKHGAVSLPTIKHMAQGARSLFKTDFSIAISGIAGPSGSSKEKPLGLTFIAVATKKKIHAARFIFKGSRLSVKKQAATKALELLKNLLDETR